MVLLSRFEVIRHFRKRRRLEHVYDEHRVVRGERPTALGDDVGMVYAVLVCRIDERIYTVVDIFLNGIIDRTLAAGRPCAVIVHPETASAVHEVDVVAHLMQLHIELCSLAQSRLNVPYLGYLTAYVEVYEPQRVVQVLLVENRESLEQLARRESELARVTSAVLPFARSARGEFYPYAKVRLDIELPRRLGNDFEFVEFLDDNENSLAHLLRQQSQLYIVLVLVSVADDERVALTLQRDDGMQLRLRARLESQVELSSVRDYLLHHGLHLVHLYRIDDKVLPFVVIFLCGNIEAVRRFLDSVVQDIGKTQQHRCRHVAQCKLVHHITQVNLRVVLARCDVNITLFVDAKIGRTPSVDVVQLLRVFNCPFLHCCRFFS